MQEHDHGAHVMDEEASLTIAILAGGESRRMGRDKALLPFDGPAMLARVAARALETGYPVMVVGRARPEGWDIGQVRFVEDNAPGAGPLRGIVTALGASGGDVIAVACDMPLLDAHALRWLASLHEPGGNGVVVMREGRMEPLFSLYGFTLLSRFEARLAAGELAMKEAIEACGLRGVEAPPEIARLLTNVNTPGDLEELSRALRA
jgi:molybdopterin-guanine dinucleotide biosynthesis protein A